MQFHEHVAWWTAPQLHTAGTMFLVKLLGPVAWRSDGFTARGSPKRSTRVRVCYHESNRGHPDCGSTFVANGADLIAVQYGHNHN
jgi:hypothetical protein